MVKEFYKRILWICSTDGRVLLVQEVADGSKFFLDLKPSVPSCLVPFPGTSLTKPQSVRNCWNKGHR